jgi:hypothetical protein
MMFIVCASFHRVRMRRPVRPVFMRHNRRCERPKYRDTTMAKKRSPIIEVAKRRNNRVLWLDHVELLDDDLEWLAAVERLTIWNVKLPPGLLARLEKLWWLDIRGGSATDLRVAKGASNLQYLAVNQVRGMRDLSIVSEMTSLRYLSLYGLPRVKELPSLSALGKLEHASLGQMRGLLSLRELLKAPNLRELQFIRKISVSDDDVDGIINHPSIKQFGWSAEDVPDKVWVPVVEKIGLPSAPSRHPEDWFGLADSPTAHPGQ